MPTRTPSRKLLVEGDEDKRVIPELIEANGVPWGNTPAAAVVFIQPFDGVEKMLAPGAIETEMKAPGLEAIGILVDADESAVGRWQAVRNRCLRVFPNLPADLPTEGLVAENADGLRLGVWVMLDNRTGGMMETFLACLLPEGGGPLLTYVDEACTVARIRGARCKDTHTDKMRIHTWLAWQDPPGRQLHQAILERILAPTAEGARPFVAWFRLLFRL